MDTGGPDRLGVIATCVGVPLFILLLIGVFMELSDRRREDLDRFKDMERTGGWGASADALLILFVGAGAGWVSALLLSEPVIRFVVAQLTSGSGLAALDGYLRASPVNLAGLLLALLLLLAAGPLAAYWRARRSPVAGLFVAALCGAAAFGMLSALLLEIAASAFASQELIRLGLSSAPYTEIDWLVALAQGIQATFLGMLATFIFFIFLGASIAGLSGVLTANQDLDQRPVHWATPLAVTATPLLILLVIYNVLIYALLSDAIHSILARVGLAGGIGANEILIQTMILPLLTLGLLQVLALLSALNENLPSNQSWMISFGLALMGLLDIATPYLLMRSDALVLPASALGLTLLAGAVQLVRRAASPAPYIAWESPDTAHLPHWGLAGMGAGLLTGLLAQLTVAAPVFMVLFNATIIEPVGKMQAPAVSPGWLEEQLRVTFSSNLIFCFWTVLGFVLVGGLGGLLCQWIQSNLFLPMLWVSLARVGRAGVSRLVKFLLVVLADIILVLLITQADLVSVPLLALLTGLFTLALLYPRLPLRWPAWVVILVFFLAAAGVIGLSINQLWALTISPLVLRTIYALLVGPCLGISVALFLSIFTPRSRRAVQMVVLLCLALALTFNRTNTIGSMDFHGRVIYFDGVRWQPADLSSVRNIGDRINYYFYTDRQGRLWLTSQSGLFLRQTEIGWQPYLLESQGGDVVASTAARISYQLLPPFINENEDGTFWVVVRALPGLFNPSDAEHLFTALGHKTGQVSEEGEPYREYVPSRDMVLGMDIDPSGGIWLATMNGGVIHVAGGRPLEDAQWTTYKTDNGLRSSDIYSVAAGRDGSIWAGSTTGVDHYVQGQWQPVLDPALPVNQPVNELFEDMSGQIWVAEEMGGALWDGQRWHSFAADPGWPGTFEIHHFYQDKTGRIWAVGPGGALRFDGQRWLAVIRDHELTAFSEAADGNVWLGGKEGLVRVSQDGILQRFDAKMVGYSFDGVTDLHVDKRGWVWVSLNWIEKEPLNGALVQVITGSLFAVALCIVLVRSLGSLPTDQGDVEIKPAPPAAQPVDEINWNEFV